MISAALRPDFADWLSPMIVKELRQGLRSRMFVAAFYITQVLMILSVIFNLAATMSEDFSGPLQMFLGGLFWFLIALPLLFFMPVRGFNALHGELKSGTLELVFLTRLSAWKIAAGKWTGLMVQTLLLVCSILPYVLLRYFLGGINILDDLQKLFFLLCTSAVLTAVTIALSPFQSKLLRGLFILGMILGIQFLASAILAGLAVGNLGGGTGQSYLPVYLTVLVFVPLGVTLCLEIAASLIAPSAENHAIRKRLLGCVALLSGWVLYGVGHLAFGEDWDWAPAIGIFFLAPVIVDALGENVVNLNSHQTPFARRGRLGRIAGFFLTPGWVSGAWFSAVVAFVCVLPFLVAQEIKADLGAHHIGASISFFGALVFPACIIRLIMPQTRAFLGFYFVFQVFFAIVTMMVGIMSRIAGEPFTNWISWIPTCAFLILTSFSPGDDAEIPAALGITFTAVSFGVLLCLTIPVLRRNRLAPKPAPSAHGA